MKHVQRGSYKVALLWAIVWALFGLVGLLFRAWDVMWFGLVIANVWLAAAHIAEGKRW